MNNFYSFLDWQFWLYGWWFLFAFSISIIPTGWLLVKQTQLKNIDKILLTPVLGMVAWTLQGYIFGFFNLRFLSFFYLGFSLYYFFKLFFSANKNFFNSGEKLITTIKETFSFFPKKALWLIGLGSILQLLAVFPSGIRYPAGITFYWLNAYDGILHLTFIKELVRHFPPYQPGAYNLFVTNYHYLSDLFLAELVRIWHLPISHLFFHYFPLLFTPLLGVITYLLVFKWTKSKTAAFWSTFFHYFAGDMFYVFSLLFHSNLGSHTDTLDNGIIQLLNMPQAFAKLIFLGGLIFFDQWVKKKDKTSGILAIVSLASVVGFKVYFGLAAALGLTLYVVLELGKEIPQLSKNSFSTWKKTWLRHQEKILLLLLFAFISAVIFFPVNSHSGGLFWAPLEWPKLLLSFDKLNWNEWWLRLQVYQAAQNIRALFVWYGLAVIIFVIATFGTRLISLLFPKYLLTKIQSHNFIFLYPTIFIFSFIGMNFLQSSGLHNVFNFFVVALSFLTLFSGVVLDHPLLKNNFGKSLILLVVILTLPRVLLTSYFYLFSIYQGFERKIISPAQETALNYLDTADKVRLIQTHPNNHLDNFAPYTYLFTKHYSYFGGRGILASHNQPIQNRQDVVKKMFSTKDLRTFETLAKENAISHVIFEKKENVQTPFIPLNNACLENIAIVFENEAILIIKILTN